LIELIVPQQGPPRLLSLSFSLVTHGIICTITILHTAPNDKEGTPVAAASSSAVAAAAASASASAVTADC
jgi:hypothetical protein